MSLSRSFDVIIVGGSYSGLAAGMALGRALRTVLILDSGLPCNRQTPYSHNFLTQDGKPPAEIAAIGKRQVEQYETVSFRNDMAVSGVRTVENTFELTTASGDTFQSAKLIFATGITDILPDIPGIAGCWGISALHCPYCHGYEVRGEKTGVLGNSPAVVEYAGMLSNWTGDLTLFTNGPSTLTDDQTRQLERHHISIETAAIDRLEHNSGQLQQIALRSGATVPVTALYAQLPFRQHCDIPAALGCGLTEEGYIQVDPMQKTTVPGIYACGDGTSRFRTVANAVATGTAAGMMLNKELVLERF